MSQYFHFTLGPVQSFVAQARRTRDFWSGSFLLSWLSAVAMQEVIRQTKDEDAIKFPTQNKNYLLHLTGQKQNNPPQQGGVPNRFKAKVPATGFDPTQVASAVQQAWKGLAEHIWNKDELYQLKGGIKTRQIWDQQIEKFWEINWCLTKDEKDSSALDRRKNWRTHFPPAQPGVKCMMMDGWQEISGAQRPNDSTLKNFWSDLRKGRIAIKTDLRDQEHLCAIAYVKRRFARHFANDFIVEINNRGGEPLWQVFGWQVPTGVPSVAYLAAAPWIAQMLKTCDQTKIQAFHKNAFLLTEEYGECQTQIHCIEEALQQRAGNLAGWKALDGNLFFDSALENKRLWNETHLGYLKETHNALKALRKASGLEPVSPFYAVLVMDGDSLGEQMSKVANQQVISDGLEKFTREVEEIVQQQSGFLIYAGGDDVLAILPLEFAMQCALALRRHYQHCFAGSDITTSISAAILYAHIKMPLGRVLSQAHHVLDHIAKEYHGRDALAVQVLKPGGEHLQWGMPWKKAIDENTDTLIIDKMSTDFRNQEQHAPFASRFFYRIREHYQLLAPRKNPNSGIDEMEISPAIDKKVAIDLLASEYINSGATTRDSNAKMTMEQARITISELLSQCFTCKRTTDPQSGRPLPQKQWQYASLPKADAALLLHFLAKKGIER